MHYFKELKGIEKKTRHDVISRASTIIAYLIQLHMKKLLASHNNLPSF